MKRVHPEVRERTRGRHVISETSDGDGLAGVVDFLPLAEQIDEHVALEALVKKLGDEVHVGHQSGLKDNRNVGCVEELDGVRTLLTANLLILNREVNTESLEIDNDQEH